MDYIQLTFSTATLEQNELLIALLSDAGFEGFEEKEPGLVAVIPAAGFDAAAARDIAAQTGHDFIRETVPQQNWNAIWEAGFRPVTVPGFCTVRAAFHAPAADTPYEIVITPKMSFGTGHHATTFLMMQAVQALDFRNKRVLDFGTGTGILAILAARLGAAYVLAIDNDEWSVQNTLENAAVNNTELDIRLGSLEDVPPGSYDLILANINRNILVRYMQDMTSRLPAGGRLVLSGILEADEHVIRDAAAGLRQMAAQAKDGWLCMTFIKEI